MNIYEQIQYRAERFRAIQANIKPKHKDQPVNVTEIQSLDGQIHPSEVQHLHDLAASLPPNSTIVEIGSYRGKSSAAIASGMPADAMLVCIDPWTKQPPLITEHTSNYHTIETIEKFQQATQPWKSQITQIIGYPLDVLKFWHLPIDMIFIDCCKRYHEIRPIWEGWIQYCRNIIATHDYNPDPQTEFHYPGVIQAVDEIVRPITTNHQHIHYTFSGSRK